MLAELNPALYVAGVSALSAIAYAWLHYRVTSFKNRRVDRIRKLVKEPETTAAMPTDVLTDKEEKQERRDMVRGVKTRFSVIRRTLVACVVVVWALALTLPFLGKLPSTMISVMVAISTAVIGIAARPLVENLISGIVISFSRQLRVGDTLMMDGQYGTVEDISITHTKIKTWDWKRYVIPNSRMLNKEFVNLTLNDSLLWAYLEFSVSYEADLDEVSRIARKVAAESEHHNDQEEPQFWVMRMDRESVVCWIAAWAETPGEAWNLKSDIATRLVRVFREKGIPTHAANVNLRGGPAAAPSAGL
ncbi:mechanosensitive ion channel [Pseudodesulfovibrio cashew]|uniref:Mechanosensitive ion channel n=1 Tax=Pseudodesulfovibrio cashew TaxID=2678688 RepID=A0A6I6JB14_9BACT|nr:mechanosensitive ion channel domain-containing protein [Pseudodesulfovibrio cashew]QGY39925.1 mechanosensitive ion channel [Pseudodesulfovibrio cashew]